MICLDSFNSMINLIKQDIFIKCMIFISILSNWVSSQVDSSTEGQTISFDCDLNLEEGLWVYGGNTVITPAPIIDNLIIFHTFDETALFDHSGNSNHASGKDIRGPPHFMSQGNSLSIPSEGNIMINGSQTINNAFATEFSVSFWIYVNDFGTLATQQWDLIAKGDGSYSSFRFTVDVGTHNVMFTSETTESGPITLVSNARLTLYRWTHITLLRSKSLMILYFNGNLDSVKETKAGKQSAGKPVYIGRMPWQDTIGGGWSMKFYVDEFKVWDKVIDEQYIEAESGFSIGTGTEPHAIELGCLSCDIKTAEHSWTSQYHLCSTVEVYSFALSVARSMGWAKGGRRVWSDVASEENSTDLGLGIWWRNYY